MSLLTEMCNLIHFIGLAGHMRVIVEEVGGREDEREDNTILTMTLHGQGHDFSNIEVEITYGLTLWLRWSLTWLRRVMKKVFEPVFIMMEIEHLLYYYKDPPNLIQI